MKRQFLYFLLSLCLLSSDLLAQQAAAPPLRLRLFLDCDDCDFSYFRRNVTFTDFVRDPMEADIHVLVTRQFTASRGRNYRLNFIGKLNFDDLNYQLEFHSPQSDTEALRREGLAQQLRMGLMPFMARTQQPSAIKFDYEQEESPEEITAAIDPWNFWVLRFSLGLDGQAQEQQNEISANGSFRADRITEQWKFRSNLVLLV